LIPLVASKIFLFSESLNEDSEDESMDEDVFMDEAKSEVDSTRDLEDDEEYETITISEAGVDGERYDQNMDMFEEEEAMKKFKGKNSCTYIWIYFNINCIYIIYVSISYLNL